MCGLILLVALGACSRDRDHDGIGRDEDCDDHDPDVGGPGKWFADADSDGFPGTAVEACAVPEGGGGTASDCDDRDPDAFPGAGETCNGRDDDCDGEVDEGLAVGTWYRDTDGDGYGGTVTTVQGCAAPSGFVGNADDCDDRDAGAFPGAPETVADGVDQDCDGADACYEDADRDSYGGTDEIAGSAGCTGDGESAVDTDCDDGDWDIYPGAPEVAGDGVDQDCDGFETCYEDVDGDGYGAVEVETDELDCSEDDLTPLGGDCDETDPLVNPGVDEVCGNGLDDNCDGSMAPCGITGTVDLSDADVILEAEGPGDYAGFDVDGAGDVDGDGFDDLLVGSIDAYTAYLVRGPVSGTRSLTLADARYTWDNNYGYPVAGVGDVDGDGYADVLLGAPNWKAEPTVDNPGLAVLLHGPLTGQLDEDDADARIVGAGRDGNFGFSVAGGGDVDADGVPDLLVNACDGDTYPDDSIGTYVFPGPTTGTTDSGAATAFLAPEQPDGLGTCALAFAGDVDGDGIGDLIVGESGNDSAGDSAGAAFLVLGPVSGSLTLGSQDGANLRGEHADEAAGISVAGAGDLNGDGKDDLVIGASANDSTGLGAGAAYVLFGPVTGERELSTAEGKLVGTTSEDLLGISVDGAGDVDADGLADIVAGARYEDEGGDRAGAAYLVLGPASGVISASDAHAKMVGEDQSDQAGRWVAGAGDTNADGYDDVLVGAPYRETDEFKGTAYLLLGGGY